MPNDRPGGGEAVGGRQVSGDGKESDGPSSPGLAVGASSDSVEVEVSSDSRGGRALENSRKRSHEQLTISFWRRRGSQGLR